MKLYLDWFFVAAAARLGWYATNILIEQIEHQVNRFFSKKDDYKYEPARFNTI